jgi:Ser/Thr protein kinase RdoA (MazF antagonist)
VACGAALARVEIALMGFTHPAKDQALIWDLQHALRLREVADALAHHPRGQAGLLGLLDAFEARVTPALPHLRRQVLHNDMNGGNTLVDAADHGRFGGLIDFGDMVETAVAIDVATALPAMLGPDMPAGAAFGHFLRGFVALRPLLAEEVALLPLLTALRVAMSVVLQSWHRRVQPDNPHYADVTDAEIERRLGQIAEIMAPETEREIHAACAR